MHPMQHGILQKEKWHEQPSSFQRSLCAISQFRAKADLLFIPSRLLESQDVLLNRIVNNRSAEHSAGLNEDL